MNIKPYFLRKIKEKKMKLSSAAILLGSLRGNKVTLKTGVTVFIVKFQPVTILLEYINILL